MSNYPAGTSAGDPNAPWNAPDMSHDHEWRPLEDMYPIFEDGAAIFVEECVWRKVLNSEPGYEGERVVTDSIPCEEQRTIRFEPVAITNLSSQVTLTRDEFEDEDGDLVPMVEAALSLIEGKNERSGGVSVLEHDPDYQSGKLVVRVKDKFKITYAPDKDVNLEAD